VGMGAGLARRGDGPAVMTSRRGMEISLLLALGETVI